MKTKYNVIRGENKFEIIFNANANTQAIGEPQRVRAFLNALTNLRTGTGFQHVEVGGLMLNSSLDNYENVFETVDSGYCYGGKRMEQLVADGLILRSKEIKPGVLYRLQWNGFNGHTASEVTYHAFEDGEADWKTHNRNALYICQAYQILTKGEKFAETEKAFNIRLFYNNKLADFANYKAKMLGLTEEQVTPEDALESIKGHNTSAQVRRTLYAVGKAAAKVNEITDDDYLRLYQENAEASEIRALDLVDRVIAYWTGGVRAANQTLVTTENLKVVVAACRRMGMMVEIIEG